MKPSPEFCSVFFPIAIGIAKNRLSCEAALAKEQNSEQRRNLMIFLLLFLSKKSKRATKYLIQLIIN